MSSTEVVVRRSIEREFDRYSHSRRMQVLGYAAEHDKERLQSLCARPELGPFLTEAKFRFDEELQRPGVTTGGYVVTLRPDVLDAPTSALVLIRHALELCMLQRLLPGIYEATTQLVAASLACHTATAYYTTLLDAERHGVGDSIPEWIVSLANDGIGEPDTLLEHLRRYGTDLLTLQGVGAELLSQMEPGSVVESMVRVLLEETLLLGYPAEWLLTQGGDNRLLVDTQTGLNKYGCSPKPRPWAVTFASCTGSSISETAYAAAERLREELLLGAFRNGLAEASLEQADRTRREIADVFAFDSIPGTEVVLASSGTDVELIALHLSLAGHSDMVTNIIVAPNEVGSGTVPAASGRHFDSRTPVGSIVEPGTPVAGIDSERVELVEIPIRHETGEPLGVGELDRQICEAVDCACSNGRRVLLHLLDSSKTGVGAPSIETAQRIKESYGESVNVLVDAAQMRLSRQVLQKYVASGFLVLVTGSKFFTGPPFSGALIIPPAIAHIVDTLPTFPRGFGDYATPSDFPDRWRALTSCFAGSANVGLLLRWRAALWEIKAFYAVPPARQFETVRRFLTTVIDAIQENPDLELITAPALDRLRGESEAQWDDIRTIFSFFVKRRDHSLGKAVYLSFDEAQWAYRWLNIDIAGFLPNTARHDERRVAAVRCHIGQPVRMFQQNGTWYAALRIAVGARLISGVEFDPELGESPEERFNTELNNALTILEKLSVIVRYWDELAIADIEHRYQETIEGFRF